MADGDDNAPRMVEVPQPEPNPEELSPEKKIAIFRNSVLTLLEALRALYLPGARITFIVRYPGQPGMTSFVTDETDVRELGQFLVDSEPPKPIEEGSSSVN